MLNKIRLRNIKRAKLKQKQAELKLAINHNEDTTTINKEIQELEKEIDSLV